MGYAYNQRTPLEVAEEFIDSYIRVKPVEELIPGGISTYLHSVFLSGVEKAYLQNNKKEYRKYIEDYFERALNEKKMLNRVEESFWCSPKSLDFRQLGNLLFRMYDESKDMRYLDSISELVESLATDYPKNSHGGLWHMKSQPNQMWLDGLYMVGPLCAKYGMLTGKKEFCEMAVNQAFLMYENMKDEKNGLLYHGWDDSFTAEWADKKTGLSAEKWGRAMGWFTVATVDILEAIEEGSSNYNKLLGYVKSIFASLVKVQRESGFWCQVIDKPNAEGNWEETSGTCLIAYSMAKAVRLGFIDKKYLDNAKKAYEAIVDSLKIGDNGEIVLEKVCIGTCIDSGTYEHYISRETVVNDLHGSGAFLLMCTEMNLCLV